MTFGACLTQRIGERKDEHFAKVMKRMLTESALA
jgi:hypothetical protein